MDRLAAMETFVRVVETGSFSAAARTLKLGQPAVSKTIAELERRLGVRLLIRSPHSLSATEAGQNFYDHARLALQNAEEAERAARGAAAGLTGPLRISAPVTFARLHVIPRLSKFLAMHPGLTMDVILDDRRIDLVEEGIDLALRMRSFRDSSSLIGRRVASAPRYVVGTPAYFARSGVPVTPTDLSGHAAVVYAPHDVGAWSFRDGATEVSVTLSGQLRMSAAEGVRAAVLADMGFAIAASWMFNPELMSGAVQRVLTDWSLPPLDLWVGYPAGRMPSAKARAFAAFVEVELNGAQAASEQPRHSAAE